jgi:hypothetical protein
VKKIIRVFKSFEEQEMDFLQYFFRLTPSERLRELMRIQEMNFPDFNKPGTKKITVLRHELRDGHPAS